MPALYIYLNIQAKNQMPMQFPFIEVGEMRINTNVCVCVFVAFIITFFRSHIFSYRT